jgi:hypothetical protein
LCSNWIQNCFGEFQADNELESIRKEDVMRYFQPSLLFRHLSAGIEKNNENLRQNSQAQGQDLNALSLKYETGVILTRPWRSAIQIRETDWSHH